MGLRSKKLSFFLGFLGLWSFVMMVVLAIFVLQPMQNWNDNAAVGLCEIVPSLHSYWCKSENGITKRCFEGYSYLRLKNKTCGIETFRGVFTSKKEALEYLAQFTDRSVPCYFDQAEQCRPEATLKSETFVGGIVLFLVFATLGFILLAVIVFPV